MIQLKAIFTREAAGHLYETPLSEDQVIEDLDAERVVVTATVQDTQQLEWWLLGFGELVQIVEPESLRSKIRTSVKMTMNQYTED